jgi:hypothetical protein
MGAPKARQPRPEIRCAAAHRGKTAPGLLWNGREEASVTQQAVSFVLGIVAPVALVSWLLVLH